MTLPVEFESNGDKIRGIFYSAAKLPPAAELPPVVILLSGFPPLRSESPLGLALARQGIHILTFDFRGTLKSEGVFALRNALQDIQAAITFLQRDDVQSQFSFDAGKLVLGGMSFGGGMALAYAASHPEIRRIFTLAGDDYGDFAREYERNPGFAARIDAVFDHLWAASDTVRLASRHPLQELLQDPKPYDLRLNASALVERGILLIGGWDDSNVKIEDRILPVYRALKEAGSEAVHIAAFQDDHSFEKSSAEVVELIVRWVKASGSGELRGRGGQAGGEL